MNVYLINWDFIVQNFMLLKFRKPKNIALAKILITPIAELYASFIAFRSDCLYRGRHNSQIVYMEAMLNDKFDTLQRRIRIVNAVFKQPVYFYEPLENRDVYFYEPAENKDVYFYEQNEFTGDGVDFSVCVPPSLKPNTLPLETDLVTRMRGQIDYYKLYSKNYNILWVQVNN